MASKEQVLSIRENSLARRLISPATRQVTVTSVSPLNNNVSHVAKIKERIMMRNNRFANSGSRQKTAHSTSSSPMNSVSPQGRLGKFIENIRKKNESEFGSIAGAACKGTL